MPINNINYLRNFGRSTQLKLSTPSCRNCSQSHSLCATTSKQHEQLHSSSTLIKLATQEELAADEVESKRAMTNATSGMRIMIEMEETVPCTLAFGQKTLVAGTRMTGRGAQAMTNHAPPHAAPRIAPTNPSRRAARLTSIVILRDVNSVESRHSQMCSATLTTACSLCVIDCIRSMLAACLLAFAPFQYPAASRCFGWCCSFALALGFRGCRPLAFAAAALGFQRFSFSVLKGDSSCSRSDVGIEGVFGEDV